MKHRDKTLSRSLGCLCAAAVFVALTQAAVAQSTPAPTQPAPAASEKGIEFSDKPDFSVAGVTDWTAVGGHGSDATLRTSETLTRETLNLPAPQKKDLSGSPGTEQKDAADLHRRNAELAERQGDPLAAVQEFRLAAQSDPSEENYFAWGSELLLHRAVWQAAEVFEDGAKAHPESARLKTAWGTALFSGALYEQAATQLCAASDLRPEDAETYRIMGKAELASPEPLPCVEQRLGRFVAQHPESAEANFLYAMVLERQDRKANLERARELLNRATEVDPKCGEAWLQLGILAFEAKQNPEAVRFYTQAIAADPKDGEAHYRLALAYGRTGENEKAKRELQLHDAIKQARADAVEQERRQIKQFVIAPEAKAAAAAKQ